MDTLYVDPDGPICPELILVGEAPGQEEVARGLNFVGPSGHVLWAFAGYEGIHRDACYVTNLFKEPVDPSKVYHENREYYDAAVIELWDELGDVQCPVIATLGAWATKSLLYVPELSMYWSHGKTFKWRGRSVIPCYHPAAGLHEPSALALTQWDLGRVADALAGRLSVIRPGLPVSRATACDTEGTVEHPWRATIASRQGGQIRPSFWPKRSTSQRQKGVFRGGSWVFHNAAWDLRVLAALDLLPGPEIHDTMVLAHVLQTEPLGLKDLVRRYVGWEGVVEYEDLVVPHLCGRALAIDEKRTEAAMKRKRDRVDALQAICGPPDYDAIKGFEEYALSDAENTLLVFEALTERWQESIIPK